METVSGDIVEGEWREENVGASVLQSMPNISEMHLLIIFGDLTRFPGNEKWFKNIRKYDFLCSSTFIFIIL